MGGWTPEGEQANAAQGRAKRIDTVVLLM